MSAATATSSSGRRRLKIAATPSAARMGTAKPNVMNRSAGNHPVTSAAMMPTAVAAVHVASSRHTNPWSRRSPGAHEPTAASGTVAHGT